VVLALITPTNIEFPEDENLNLEFRSAQTSYYEIQENLNSESQAAEILSRVDRIISTCESKMKEGLKFSVTNWGVFAMTFAQNTTYYLV
jgi:hypothetical protein